MRPIQTPAADEVFVGPKAKGIEPLPIERKIEALPDGTIATILRSRWRLSDEERAAIVLGADFVLDVFGGALPPVRPAITEPPLTDPPTVARLVDAAMSFAIAYSFSTILRDAGFERPLDVVASWSDEDKKAVGDWLVQFDGADEAAIEALRADPPAVLR